jgi:hypothetical protein
MPTRSTSLRKQWIARYELAAERTTPSASERQSTGSSEVTSLSVS